MVRVHVLPVGIRKNRSNPGESWGKYEVDMEDKIDRLFLEKDCPFCGVIRAELDMKAAAADDFKGLDGQEFFVFSALSNEASKELLEKFGLAGKNMPVLICHDGEVRTDVQQIVAYLRKHKMSATI